MLTHPFCWPYLRRGTERNMDGLARYLHRRGHEVITLSTCPDGARTTSGDYGKQVLHASRWHPLLGKLRIEATHLRTRHATVFQYIEVSHLDVESVPEHGMRKD